MINFLCRKLVSYDVNVDKKDMIFRLTCRRNNICNVVYFFGFLVFYFIIFLLMISTKTVAKNEYPVLFFFISLVLLFFVIRYRKFFSNLMSKLFYFLFTRRGNAISKKDFKIIKRENIMVYNTLLLNNCRGYCYDVCFSICKALKKGEIQFIATKNMELDDEENKIKEDYIMHVIYVNNGWAFDTYSACQFPVENMYELFQSTKKYGIFTYEQISKKDIGDFFYEHEDKMEKWGKENNCYLFDDEDDDD